MLVMFKSIINSSLFSLSHSSLPSSAGPPGGSVTAHFSAAKFIMGYVGELPAAIASSMDNTDENLVLEVLRLPGHGAPHQDAHVHPRTRHAEGRRRFEGRFRV